MNPRHLTRPLTRARVLAALRELDVAIDFDWMADDLPPTREGAQNGSRGAREAA